MNITTEELDGEVFVAGSADQIGYFEFVSFYVKNGVIKVGASTCLTSNGLEDQIECYNKTYAAAKEIAANQLESAKK